jgi:hypothetical protein
MPDTIPPEIVEIFLKYAITSRPVSHGACVKICDLLCVNSTWRDIGLRHVWSDIVVDLARLHRFGQTPLSANLELVKSFTFSSDAPKNEIFKKLNEVTQIHEDLTTLVTILPRMNSLQTFSFYIKPHAFSGMMHGAFISRAILSTVVSALPSGLENLEIDTKCNDRFKSTSHWYYGKGKHLCDAIAERIPRLAHLRLRLALLCPKVIRSSKRLKSCVINLQWTNGKTEVVPCHHDTVELDRRLRDPCLWRRKMAANGLRRRLVASLERVIPATPALSQLKLVTGWSDYSYAIGQIVVRDLLNNRTTSYPLQSLDRSPHGDVFLLRRSDTSDVAGRLGDVEELIEGDTWQATIQGSRFPYAYKVSALGSKHEWHAIGDFATPQTWPLRINQAEGEDSLQLPETSWRIIMSPGRKLTLWESEEKAGKRLVEVQSVDGLGDVGGLILPGYQDNKAKGTVDVPLWGGGFMGPEGRFF